MSDLIDRQAAIDAPEKFIKDSNPEHFVGHQKFIEYMDNAEIWSFGNWQFAIGFNIGLTVAEVAIKDLPSAQPEKQRGEWIRHTRVEPVYSIDGVETWGIKCQCNKCCFTTTVVEDFGYYNFCPHCGADMRGEDYEID